MSSSRREFLTNMSTITLGGLTATLFSSADLLKMKQRTGLFDHLQPQELADDEAFWNIIQDSYTPSSLFTNLNNGGVSPQQQLLDAIRVEQVV